MSAEKIHANALMAAKYYKKDTNRTQKYVFYNKELEYILEKRAFFSKEMRKALEEKQFQIYFQPKFSLKKNQFIGAEALVRWHHPEKGILFPGEFIPVFESNGFIGKLDLYVWDKVCSNIRQWLMEGKKIHPISVNLSRISLYNPMLTENLLDIARSHQVEITYLQLEITESAYMSNPTLMCQTISKLRDAGFCILMDDFGSEYSSLNTLKEIYVDALKMDMKFFSEEKQSDRTNIILSYIIEMGKKLGMDIIMEGVETQEQIDFIENTDCDYVQGYYYAKPVPKEDYEKDYLG